LSEWEELSGMRVLPAARPRKLAKVPFVELADGRLQGVVSSGSDIERVYVSSVEAGDFAFACSTNNNRPCGGARGAFCKHIDAMIGEAVVQYGGRRVAGYLHIDLGSMAPNVDSIRSLMDLARPSASAAKPAAQVFSRFLRHLAYLELEPTTEPLPELQWFAPSRAAA